MYSINLLESNSRLISAGLSRSLLGRFLVWAWFELEFLELVWLVVALWGALLVFWVAVWAVVVVLALLVLGEVEGLCWVVLLVGEDVWGVSGIWDGAVDRFWVSFDVLFGFTTSPLRVFFLPSFCLRFLHWSQYFGQVVASLEVRSFIFSVSKRTQKWNVFNFFSSLKIRF